jgi:hypothetical protein
LHISPEDPPGQAVSGSVPATLTHLDRAQHPLHSFVDDLVAGVNAAPQAKPELAKGQRLHAHQHVLGTDLMASTSASREKHSADASARLI